MTLIVVSDDQARAQASTWLARLQRDDLAEQDGVEFDAWLTASPANRAAYAEALALWHEFEDGAVQVLDALAEAAQRPAGRPAPTRRWLVGAGGFAIAAGLALAVMPPVHFRPSVQTYVTGKGQRQRVTLADGTIIDLNAETRLSVSLGRSERKVILGEGEAIFDVAHDERRPFTVEASSRIVRVVGTQFDVRSRLGDLTVTVARGKVEVRPIASAGPGQTYLLTPGERLEVNAAGTEALKAVDPQEAFAWRAGRLVYRGQPLADVVADMNRQFAQQTEIGDPELAKTPITGVVVLDDPQAVVTRLSLMLPIRSVPSQRGILLLRK